MIKAKKNHQKSIGKKKAKKDKDRICGVVTNASGTVDPNYSW